MTESNATSDLSIGLVLALGAVTALASIGTGATAYLSTTADGGETMQLYSGLLVALALVAGSIAVAVLHLYD